MKTSGRWLLLCLGLLLLWAAFVSPLSAYAPRSLKQIWQYGHIGLFGIWTYLLLSSSIVKLRPAALFFLVLAGSLLLGLAIELAQLQIGRNFSYTDLLLDLLGGLLGFCLASYGGLLRLPTRFKFSLYTVSGLSLLLALAPLVPILIDELNMSRNLPVLSDFRNGLERERWKGDVEIVQLNFEKGRQQALRIGISTSHYSGASLAHFYPDWRAYRQLQVDVYNPDQDKLKLTLRIHDDAHYGRGRGDYNDRYNGKFLIEPGWNTIRIDLADVANAADGRRIDMSRIQGLGLFTVDSKRQRWIFISNLRLSGDKADKSRDPG